MSLSSTDSNPSRRNRSTSWREIFENLDSKDLSEPVDIEDEEMVRKKMKKYWQQFQPSLESMMLSHNASILTQTEQTEVLDYLPSYTDKHVLELGAGIGRYTSELAKEAKEVTAVDFIQSYIDTNKESNSHFTNIAYQCADVTTLEYPDNNFDLVFTNWLFMYLTDEEVIKVFKKILRWVKPEGHFFIRESCYHQSGNMKRGDNPTYYRTPLKYIEMLQDISHQSTYFTIHRAKSIYTYIKYQSNPNQLCFVAQKTGNRVRDAALGVDSLQYSFPSILRYERIYGHTWITPGGEHLTRELLPHLNLKVRSRVLNVGCMTGGAAIFMARHYGAYVHGVDLSGNMIHLAIERQGSLAEPRVKQMIQYEMCDLRVEPLEEESYDAVYCRDSNGHLKEKSEIFKNMYDSLKPGGRLVMTDYCLGQTKPSEEFLDYIKRRGYTLITLSEYKNLLTEAGFKVELQDGSSIFLDTLQTELKFFLPTKDAFIEEFNGKYFRVLVEDWSHKITWVKEAMMTLAIVIATK